MATAANILLIAASFLMVVAAITTYKLRGGRNNSSDVLTLRARALTAGVAAMVLASVGLALNAGDTGIWFGGMVLIVITLATIARAGTYNMHVR